MKKARSFAILFLAFIMLSFTFQNPIQTQAKLKGSNDVRLTISAAASLKDVLNDVFKEFHAKNHNITVDYNFGGSGTLEKQIESGAPADIFLSADTKNVDKLDNKKLVVKSSIKVFAANQLVLITSKKNPLKIKSINDITKSTVDPIGLGTPIAVPAGDYAIQSLTYYKLWDKVKSKTVYGNDVKQVFYYVQSGNTPVGFVYMTDAINKDGITIVQTVPDKSHKPIQYEGAIVSGSSNSDAAKLYMDFLFSDTAKSLFTKYGFGASK